MSGDWLWPALVFAVAAAVIAVAPLEIEFSVSRWLARRRRR
jgi:hypothetical protein